MKIQMFFTGIVFILSLFLSCSKSEDMVEPELTFHEKELVFLKDFRTKVRGDWTVDKMVIAKDYLYEETQNDTIVVSPGRIFINNIYNDPVDADKYDQLEAYFYMNSEVIPFKSKLLVVFSSSGDLELGGVSGLMESDYYIPFPVYSDSFSDEYQFLNEYFFGDNYIMTLSEDGKTWVWKGLNRHIREIILTRN